MGLISISNIVEGTLAKAADVNSRVASILGVLNGNIDAANIKASSIGSTQLANSSVTAAKIVDGTITRSKLANLTTTITTASTITPSLGNYNVTALNSAATIAAPSGTPSQSDLIVLRIKDNGTAQALSWDSVYRAVGITLPSTTVAGKMLYIGMKYNLEDAKWDVLAAQGE